MKTTSFQEWIEKDLTQLFKLGKGKQMHSRAWIEQCVGTSTKILLQYNQVRALIKHLWKQYNVFRLLTRLEILLISQDKRKLMLRLYSMLLSMWPLVDMKMKQNWGKNLRRSFLEDEWERIIKFNRSISKNVSIQENRFKFVSYAKQISKNVPQHEKRILEVQGITSQYFPCLVVLL